MFNCRRDFGCMDNAREMCEPVCVKEEPINSCVTKDICHEVKHIIPVHTHMIDRHIYNHTYEPQFTCSHEEQIIDNDPCKCGQFK